MIETTILEATDDFPGMVLLDDLLLLGNEVRLLSSEEIDQIVDHFLGGEGLSRQLRGMLAWSSEQEARYSIYREQATSRHQRTVTVHPSCGGRAAGIRTSGFSGRSCSCGKSVFARSVRYANGYWEVEATHDDYWSWE